SPVDRLDPGMERLISAESARLKATGEAEAADELSSFIYEVVEILSDRFGGFLLLELWSRREDEPSGDASFRIFEEHDQAPFSTILHLEEALRGLEIEGRKTSVERVRTRHATPPGLPPLLDDADLRRLGTAVVGLELPTFFRDEEGVYPLVLRDLRRELTHAL